MKKFFPSISVGLLSICSVFAMSSCGDDDDDTIHGVSNDKKLSSLSEQEAYKLCVGFCKDVQAPMQKGMCVYTSVSASMNDSSQCQNLYATCMAEPEERCEDDCSDDDNGDWQDDSDDQDEVQDEQCDATVGEYGACMNAIASMLKDAVRQLSCDSELAELDALADSFSETPQQCKALEEKCPDMVPEFN